MTSLEHYYDCWLIVKAEYIQMNVISWRYLAENQTNMYSVTSEISNPINFQNHTYYIGNVILWRMERKA